MDVSVIYAWRAYFYLILMWVFFVINSLGKSFSEKYLALLCNNYQYYRFFFFFMKGTQMRGISNHHF